MHFIKPKLYLRIMPRFLPQHKFFVYLSGVFEIVLGILICFPFFKNSAIYLIISMLIVFLLVHINMLKGEKESAGLPKWILVLRVFFQFALMYWAYSYLIF